jgi:hypothetical protein
MHLVGYLCEDYHDARSLERKVTGWVDKPVWKLCTREMFLPCRVVNPLF